MNLIIVSILAALFVFPFMFAGCGRDVFEPATGGAHRSISLTATAAKGATRITIGGTGLAADANLSWAEDMTLETSDCGMDMAVNVDDVSADFYLALVPQPGIEPDFTVTLSDGRSWIGGLVARDWFSGEYVRKDKVVEI